MRGQEYKLVTLNVNGIHSPIKRSKIIAKMKQEKIQIINWQETHLSPQEHEKLKRFGFQNTFYSSHKSGRKRGVAILIPNSVNFELISEIKDKEGRYILVRGKLDNKEITLFNVYAPPGSTKTFFKKIFNLIVTESHGTLIVGGDLNVHIEPRLDATGPNRKKTSNAKMIQRLLKELGMFDIWREFHPKEKQFTFYSTCHAMYSRIDYLFMNNSDRHRIKNCSIGIRDISDHSGVYLTLYLDNQQKETLWRLNTAILNDKTIQKQIQTEFDLYIQSNDNGEVSPSTLWDAAKAVIRGKIISLTAYRKREKQKKLLNLQKEIKNLETKHIKQKDPQILIRLNKIKQDLNKIYDEEIEKQCKFAKQRYYEIGPKAMKLLSWRIRKQQSKNTIYKIRNPKTQKVCTELKDIQKSFELYYKDLYTQPTRAETGIIKSFLDSLDLPSIGEQQNKALLTEITIEELDSAISKLKANKTPGTDGYPSEMYKTFKPQITPMLLKCFNYVLRGGEIPQSWQEAVISIIPKQGKDKNECSSYRPISVLNVDYKLFASILSKRLEVVISELVDLDQTGFIQNRQTQDNLRRTLQIMSHITTENISAMLLSLDAEKAFDSVGWDYLYQVLARFGFNNKFIECIKGLYLSPKAKIKINGHLSKTIYLERGTRQGCPLSPTLFALFIEPLAQAIREEPEIKGIVIKKEEHKICMYADDVLLFLANPKSSIPKLMSLLNTINFYSGYKINIQKTQTLTYNFRPNLEMKKQYNFKWNSISLKYLGINLTKDLSTLFDSNYGPIYKEIKSDIAKWTLLPLDMSSRIEAIKMNVVPRLLYLFQSLPLEIPQKQFNEWDRMISRFIWNSRRPRLKFKTLQLRKENGGRALPCLQDYFFAAQLKPLLCWCIQSYESKWKTLETTQIDQPLQSLLGNKNQAEKYYSRLSTWTVFSLKLWFRILKKLQLEKHNGILSWIAFDPDFQPCTLDKRFKQWVWRGITSFSSVTSNGHFMSYQTLSDTFGLDKQDFYRYLQVRDYFNKKIKNKIKDDSNLITVFADAYIKEENKKLVSKLYECIQNSKTHSSIYIKQKWEKESNQQITEEDWTDMCVTHAKTTNSRAWREFGWKNLMRFFITPRLSALRTGVESLGSCWRQCGTSMANHFHVFWACPKIQTFWSEIATEIKKIIGEELDYSFITLYLGKIPEVFPTIDKYLIQILLVSSRKAITRKWLHADPPTRAQWIGIVKEIHCMERLTFNLRFDLKKYTKYWKKWSEHVIVNNL